MKGLAYATVESPVEGGRWFPHMSHAFACGRFLLEFANRSASIRIVDTHTGIHKRFADRLWLGLETERLGEVVDCLVLREDRLLVLTHERLVQLELKSGEFSFTVLHNFPSSANSRFEHPRRLIAPTAHPARFVFAVLRDASNAELYEVDVDTRAVRSIATVEFGNGKLAGLHFHAGLLHVLERDISRSTSIHTIDPADGRVLRVVEVEDQEEAGITRRRFSPTALAFHDHSAVFMEQVMVGDRPNRVLRPRLCRLDLRYGEWTIVESPIVTEIATVCWYPGWEEGTINTGEPADLLHVDANGGITIHVRTSHSTANGVFIGSGQPTWMWRFYRLPGQPKSLLRTSFEALDPADTRPRPKNLTIDRIYQ